MCNTFFPSTLSSPDSTHSVSPVPRMITSYSSSIFRRVGAKERSHQKIAPFLYFSLFLPCSTRLQPSSTLLRSSRCCFRNPTFRCSPPRRFPSLLSALRTILHDSWLVCSCAQRDRRTNSNRVPLVLGCTFHFSFNLSSFSTRTRTLIQPYLSNHLRLANSCKERRLNRFRDRTSDDATKSSSPNRRTSASCSRSREWMTRWEDRCTPFAFHSIKSPFPRNTPFQLCDTPTIPTTWWYIRRPFP